MHWLWLYDGWLIELAEGGIEWLEELLGMTQTWVERLMLALLLASHLTLMAVTRHHLALTWPGMLIFIGFWMVLLHEHQKPLNARQIRGQWWAGFRLVFHALWLAEFVVVCIWPDAEGLSVALNEFFTFGVLYALAAHSGDNAGKRRRARVRQRETEFHWDRSEEKGAMQNEYFSGDAHAAGCARDSYLDAVLSCFDLAVWIAGKRCALPDMRDYSTHLFDDGRG